MKGGRWCPTPAAALAVSVYVCACVPPGIKTFKQCKRYLEMFVAVALLPPTSVETLR